MTDESVLHFQASLQHRLCDRAARVQIYAQGATGENLRIEGLCQRQINRTIESEVELPISS